MSNGLDPGVIPKRKLELHKVYLLKHTYGYGGAIRVANNEEAVVIKRIDRKFITLGYVSKYSAFDRCRSIVPTTGRQQISPPLSAYKNKWGLYEIAPAITFEPHFFDSLRQIPLAEIKNTFWDYHPDQPKFYLTLKQGTERSILIDTYIIGFETHMTKIRYQNFKQDNTKIPYAFKVQTLRSSNISLRYALE